MFKPNRWRKEFEKQDDLEELSTVLTSTSVNKRISSKPKTVIEKFNTAYGICRDIATFLSSCGEKEFQEKIEILKNLKNEWQCSQFTTNVTHDQTKDVPNLDSIPCASENALSGFTLENVMLKNSKRTEKIPIRDTSKVVQHDVVAQNDTVVENTDDIETLDSDKELNNKDITDFMDNIKLETVQCRRGRPKGTKKPFWNFSKSTSAPGKKRKASDKIEQSNKKQKQHSEHASNNEKNNIWLITNKYTLTLTDKADIEGKELLNDKVIDAAQAIMKDQFTDPKINGLQPTLYKQNVKHFKKVDKDMVQILHRGSSGSGHWLTTSTLGCPEGSINVYDSIYTDLDQDTKIQICNILRHTGKCIKFQNIPVQHQVGGADCGLFAIAFAVSLCNGLNPEKLIFNQDKMRQHLISCLEAQFFSNFPFSINTNWRKKKSVSVKENIFCICRVIYDSEMVKCIKCSEWFHLRCIDRQVTENIQKNEDFQYNCAQCST